MLAARRSLLLFLVALLLPMVIAGAALEANSLRESRRALIQKAEDHAAFVATLLGRELAANMRAMQMVAQSPAFDERLDEQRFALLAARLVADEPVWRALSVSDPQGRRLVDVPVPIGGAPRGRVVDPESLQRAVASRRPTVGRVIVGPRGRPGFAVRAPVTRGGAVVYVVSAVVDPAALGALLLPADLPQTWTAQALDTAGNIVATSNPARGGVGSSVAKAAQDLRSGVYKARRSDGTDEVGILRSIPDTPWTVQVALPAQAYDAPLFKALAVAAAGGAVSLILAGLLAWLLVRETQLHRQEAAAAAERQRLEALGQLVGGVAHDFNNLLTPILGGLDLLSRRLEGDPKGLRLAEGALASAERAKGLVARLLTFSRRQDLTPREVDVEALLRGLGDLLEHSLGPEVELSLEIAPDLPSARVDPAQFELTLLNLAVNARDAMPNGGRLRIAAAAATISERRPKALAVGRYVRVSVEDSGRGMDAATLNRAIEPFFTTKAVGKGTGLGLSMVHGWAAQSGGALHLRSVVGMGTTAEVWLPAGEARPAARTQSLAPLDERIGRVLLVDDDDLVRGSTAAMLRDHGHAVLEANSAAEAMRILLASEDIDAMVTDFAMPVKSGAELVQEARAARPNLPIMIITGFAHPQAQFPADVGVLGKPFRRDELLRRVAALLPGASPVAASGG